jgi:arylformamidase
MMARDWTGFPGVPDNLVRTAYAISGIFDLGSLLGTSLNKALSLTAGTARAASPLFRPPSPNGRHLVAAVGSEESEELLNQSRRIAANWSTVGIDTSCEVVSGANHFTIIDELTTSGSSMLKQIVELAHEGRALEC